MQKRRNYFIIVCSVAMMIGLFLQKNIVNAATGDSLTVKKDGIIYDYVSTEDLGENGFGIGYDEEDASWDGWIKFDSDYLYQAFSTKVKQNQGAYIVIQKYQGSSSDIAIENVINGKPVLYVGEHFYTADDDKESSKNFTIPENVMLLDIYFRQIQVDAKNAYYSSDTYTLYNKEKTKLLRISKDATVLNIPDTVNTILDSKADKNFPGWRLAELSKLSAFNVASGNKSFSSKDGVLYNKKRTILLAYPSAKKTASYSMPNTVKDIASGAIRLQNNLKKVEISKNVKYVTPDNLTDCKKLSKIIFKKGSKLKGLHIQSCTRLPALKSITLPKSIKAIGGGCFEDCKKLRTVTINSKKFDFYADNSGDNSYDFSKITFKMKKGTTVTFAGYGFYGKSSNKNVLSSTWNKRGECVLKAKKTGKASLKAGKETRMKIQITN